MAQTSDLVAEELSEILGVEVAANQQHLSENLHLRADHPRWGPLFIKVYGHFQRFSQEGVALKALARQYAWVLAPLAEGSLPRTGSSWRVFPEIPLHPFDFTLEGCRTAAHLMADVHSTEVRSLHLSTKPAPWDLVPVRLERLSPWPSTHQLAAGLARRAAHLLADLSHGDAFRPQIRLLTEDFGARNIHVREDDGSTLMLDFEHAALGDPHWDLGKVWDEDLVEASKRDEFVHEYRSRTGSHDWPNMKALWATRFAAALAIFPYANRVRDQSFFAHGVEKLHVLDAELPGLVHR
ncbi:phosphotransferase family protein [Promicromonospora sp. Marseille-Q5078]